MKRVGTVICFVVFIGMMIALIWLFSKWIWSWNIPEWMKVLLISM